MNPTAHTAKTSTPAAGVHAASKALRGKALRGKALRGGRGGGAISRGPTRSVAYIALVALIPLLLAWALGAAAVPAAQASIAYRNIGSFGGSGTAEGGVFQDAQRLAVDPQTGNLFVADKNLNEIEVYKPVAAETGLEAAGVEFLFSIATPNPAALAVDPSNGDLYAMRPAAAAANEQQKLDLAAVPSGGTYTLTFEGETTTALAGGASNAEIEAALEGLTAIGHGNVNVFGSFPTPTVSFKGALAATNFRQMTASNGATVTTLQNGRAASLGAIAKFDPDNRTNPTTFSADATFTSPAEGAGAGQVQCFGKTQEVFVRPGAYLGGVAVDPTSGDLLVADPCKNKIERFNSTGAPIGTPQEWDGSDGAGAFTELQELAIKANGDVIVSNAGEARRYNGTGLYESVFPAIANAATVLTGMVLATDSASGETFASSATLGSEGSGPGHVDRFNDSDALIEEIGIEGAAFDGLFYGFAVRPASSPSEPSRLYALASQAVEGTARLQVFESGEAAEATMAPVTAFSSEEEAGVSGPTGYEAVFKATVTPNVGSSVVDCHFEYLTEAQYLANGGTFTGAGEAQCEPLPTGTGAVAVRGVGHGLRPNAAYRSRVVVRKKGFSSIAAEPTPPTFTTPAVAPTIAAERASSISDTAATLSAVLDPDSSALTECRFQYGTSAAYGHEATCTFVNGSGQQSQSLAEFPATEQARSVYADVEGLSPETAYHFRLLAGNRAGAREGADAAFTTRLPVALPQRHYELVSALDTNGVEVLPDLASASGDSYAYVSNTPVPGSETGGYGPFRASRNADGSWSQQYVGGPAPAPGQNGYLSPPPVYSGNDLSRVVWGTRAGIDPNDQNYYTGTATGADTYLRNALDGSTTMLSCTPAPPSTTCPSGAPQTDPANAAGEGGLGPDYVSPDGSRVLFTSERRLLPAGAASGKNWSLYEWDEGKLSLIGLRPGSGEGFVNGSTLGSTDNAAAETTPEVYGDAVIRNAVSRDGRRVAFESPGDIANGGTVKSTAHLFVRIDGERTVEASASEGVSPPVTEPWNVNFWGADANMENVFFTSASALTPDSNAPGTAIDPPTGTGGSADLYRYLVPADGDPTHGRLVDVTPASTHPGEAGAGVDKVLWVSDDGHRVYFLAAGVLAPGASPGPCPTSAEAQTGCNLYLAELAGPEDPAKITFIAHGAVILAGSDASASALTAEKFRQATANAAGSVLAFRSADDLVPGRHTGRASLTGDLVAGSKLVANVSVSAGIPVVGSQITGPGIPNGIAESGKTRITAIDSAAHTITLSHAATAGGTARPLLAVGFSQVYVYDATRGELSCASCPPDGSAPVSWASLTPLMPDGAVIGSGSELNEFVPHIRAVSSEGAVFFQTSSPLLPGDANGMGDVYEWRGGRLQLISSGTGSSASNLGDASADGSTVFFQSGGEYVRGVPAGVTRIYAARVGPAPPEAEERPPCTGEDCLAVATPQPEALTPGSFSLFGSGNPVVQPAAKRKAEPLTRAQKLARALKACAKKRNRHKRSACERQARRRYGAKRAGGSSRGRAGR